MSHDEENALRVFAIICKIAIYIVGMTFAGSAYGSGVVGVLLVLTAIMPSQKS